MRKISFCITFIGLALLFAIILLAPAKNVVNLQDMKDLKLNEKVFLSGNVSEQRDNEGFLILKINDINVICRKCKGNYFGKTAHIKGFVSEYEGEREIIALNLEAGG